MEFNQWVSLLSSIILPIIFSIPGFIVLRQAKKAQRENLDLQKDELSFDERKNLSDEALELYDRMKGQAEELQEELDSAKSSIEEAFLLKKELEGLKVDQVYLRMAVEKMKGDVETLSKALDEAISIGWKLHDQLVENHIVPVTRPVSRRKEERD